MAHLVQKRPEDCWIGTYGPARVNLAGTTSRRDRGHDVVAVPARSVAVRGILGSCSRETERYVSPTVLEISSTHFPVINFTVVIRECSVYIFGAPSLIGAFVQCFVHEVFDVSRISFVSMSDLSFFSS